MGKVTSTKCDIWSVGVVLLSLLNQAHVVPDPAHFARVVKVLFSGRSSVREKCTLLDIPCQMELAEVRLYASVCNDIMSKFKILLDISD